jgi:hypothetical protein
MEPHDAVECRPHIHRPRRMRYDVTTRQNAQTAAGVWQWVEDCYHKSYDGAPTDGSAWMNGDISVLVVRGGSWFAYPQFLRSADRSRFTSGSRSSSLGFCVGRTLSAGAGTDYGRTGSALSVQGRP